MTGFHGYYITFGILAPRTKSIWCSIPLKGGSPIGTSLGNTSPNSFIRFLTLGGRSLVSESVAVHASVPLKKKEA